MCWLLPDVSGNAHPVPDSPPFGENALKPNLLRIYRNNILPISLDNARPMFQQRNVPSNMLPGRAVNSPAGKHQRTKGDQAFRRRRADIIQGASRPAFQTAQSEYLQQMTISGNASNLISLGQLGHQGTLRTTRKSILGDDACERCFPGPAAAIQSPIARNGGSGKRATSRGVKKRRPREQNARGVRRVPSVEVSEYQVLIEAIATPKVRTEERFEFRIESQPERRRPIQNRISARPTKPSKVMVSLRSLKLLACTPRMNVSASTALNHALTMYPALKKHRPPGLVQPTPSSKSRIGTTFPVRHVTSTTVGSKV